MKLLTRLKNLWAMSSYRPSDFMQKKEMIENVNNVFKPITDVLDKFEEPKKAEIIKREEPIDEFLNQVNQ